MLGVFVLGETLRPGEAGWFVLIVAVAVMVAATVALARGEATAGSLHRRRADARGASVVAC